MNGTTMKNPVLVAAGLAVAVALLGPRAGFAAGAGPSPAPAAAQASPSPAPSGAGQAVSEKPQTGGGEELVRDTDVNDPQNLATPPPRPGAPKTRGALCGVQIENRTPWKIIVYVDGEQEAMVSSWAQLNALGLSGTNGYFVVAKFKGGNKKHWGPRTFSCSPDLANPIFTWTIDSK